MHLDRRGRSSDSAGFDVPFCFSGIPSPTKDHQSLMEERRLATLRRQRHPEDKFIKREVDYEIEADGPEKFT